jgi:hypothetical protein
VLQRTAALFTWFAYLRLPSERCPPVLVLDEDRLLLAQAAGLIVPLGSERLQGGLNSAGVVTAEEELTAGGLEDNPDVGLSSAAVATVQGVQFAAGNGCCHGGLLS